MFSILIRTSGRPKFFDKCYKSVIAQTEDYKIIVSVDNKKSLEYVEKYPVHIVQVKQGRRENKARCPWNRYFNDMMIRAEGWIIYLDDDVTMLPGALTKIKQFCTDMQNVIVWKYKFASGRVIPEKEYWQKAPMRKHIDTGCFCHHKKQQVHWVTLRASDWRVIRQLWERKMNFIWIDEVLFEAGNNGTNGLKNDYESIVLPS